MWVSQSQHFNHCTRLGLLSQLMKYLLHACHYQLGAFSGCTNNRTPTSWRWRLCCPQKVCCNLQNACHTCALESKQVSPGYLKDSSDIRCCHHLSHFARIHIDAYGATSLGFHRDQITSDTLSGIKNKQHWSLYSGCPLFMIFSLITNGSVIKFYVTREWEPGSCLDGDERVLLQVMAQ